MTTATLAPITPYGLTHQVTVPDSLLVPAHVTTYDPSSQVSLIEGVPLSQHPNAMLASSTTSTHGTGPDKNDTASDDTD